MTAGSAGEAAFQHQEVSFSVCMAALAILAVSASVTAQYSFRERRGAEVRLRLRFEAAEQDAPKAPVSPRRLLEPFGAGAEGLGLGRSCEYSVRLPVAEGASKN